MSGRSLDGRQNTGKTGQCRSAYEHAGTNRGEEVRSTNGRERSDVDWRRPADLGVIGVTQPMGTDEGREGGKRINCGRMTAMLEVRKC